MIFIVFVFSRLVLFKFTTFVWEGGGAVPGHHVLIQTNDCYVKLMRSILKY